jgi:transposase
MMAGMNCSVLFGLRNGSGDHPLRAIRTLTDEVLVSLNGRLESIYSGVGHPSIPPEMLLRATLLQAFFSIRSERMLMEQTNYNLLFRWFVGLSMDADVWHPTGFTHDRDRLLEGKRPVIRY